MISHRQAINPSQTTPQARAALRQGRCPKEVAFCAASVCARRARDLPEDRVGDSAGCEPRRAFIVRIDSRSFSSGSITGIGGRTGSGGVALARRGTINNTRPSVAGWRRYFAYEAPASQTPCYPLAGQGFNPMTRAATSTSNEGTAVAEPAAAATQGPHAPRTGRRWLFRATALALGLVVGLSVTEFVLRACDVHPTTLLIKRYLLGLDAQSIYWCYPDNPHGEFQRTPDVTYGRWELKIMKMPQMVELPLSRLPETPWCVEYHTSPQKLRDREFGPRPRGVLRVAGVGDSFAAGEGVPIERSLFKQIEVDLGAGYEVVNAAQPGHGTRDELDRLRFVASNLDCQRAIVVWIANDVLRTPELEKRQDYVNDLVLLRDERLQGDDQRWYRGRSRLVDVVDSRLHLWLAKDDLARVTADTIGWYRDCYDPAQNGENLREFEANLAAIAAVPNCQSVLVLYPLLEGIESDYPLADVHALVAAAAKRVGLPVLDLAPVFRGQQSSDLWVHPVDHHPNGRAHELAAKAIVAWLRSDVPGFLDRPEE